MAGESFYFPQPSPTVLNLVLTLYSFIFAATASPSIADRPPCSQRIFTAGFGDAVKARGDFDMARYACVALQQGTLIFIFIATFFANLTVHNDDAFKKKLLPLVGAFPAWTWKIKSKCVSRHKVGFRRSD